MKLSLRIPLTLIIVVVVTGIIAFIKLATKTGANPIIYVIIWLVVSVVLVGLTIRVWLQNKENSARK